jgi:hypothetical protein
MNPPTDDEREAWVCAKCGGIAYEHSLPTSTCIWEPVDPAARRQGPITDSGPEDPRRLVYEVRMMLSSVASHGPAALTTTDDPMYTARLLRRLSDALEAARDES